MKHALSKYIFLAALPILLIMSACAGYGKLKLPPRDETNALLADLLSHTDQYMIHYHGNSEKIVSGILFDPKDDTRHIRPEGVLWREITDAEAIASIVNLILTSNNPNYFPNLYNITGPNGDIYGYLVTGWTGLVIRPVDEQTLRIYGLKGPPEYEDMFTGGR